MFAEEDLTRRISPANALIFGVDRGRRDITELNRLAAENKSVADDLTRLIETANAPIFGVDANGKVTVWNGPAMIVNRVIL